MTPDVRRGRCGARADRLQLVARQRRRHGFRSRANRHQPRKAKGPREAFSSPRNPPGVPPWRNTAQPSKSPSSFHRARRAALQGTATDSTGSTPRAPPTKGLQLHLISHPATLGRRSPRRLPQRRRNRPRMTHHLQRKRTAGPFGPALDRAEVGPAQRQPQGLPRNGYPASGA